MPESAKPPKFLVQTITDWIDGGKLSINRLQRHVSYLQKSVAWMHTEPAQVRTCDNMSVLSCIPKPVNHLRTVNLRELWGTAAREFWKVSSAGR